MESVSVHKRAPMLVCVMLLYIRIHGINFRRSVSMVANRVNNNLVPSVFVYRSSECHVIIVLTGINIDMCNSSKVYFQIFKTFGYMKLKNSDTTSATNGIWQNSCLSIGKI